MRTFPALLVPDRLPVALYRARRDVSPLETASATTSHLPDVATDIEPVVSTVLCPNIGAGLRTFSGAPHSDVSRTDHSISHSHS